MSKKQVADYILDKRIGRGSYATVWKGHVDGGDEVVAVKVISRQTVTETTQLRQEVEVLRRISHPNIVRFRDLKKSAAHFYLVLEYCAGGDLSIFLREKGHVAENTARKFLTQIAAGLCALHEQNVLHRDLKPQNILLSDGSDVPVLKIADFGFARALQPQDMAATVCGSPLYMAPEILRHEPYDAKADLWSVGAILFELQLGRTPFSGANPLQLLANIEKNDRVPFDGAQVSTEGQDFLRSLLMRNPSQRLSSREFGGHPYVQLNHAPTAAEKMAHSTEAIVYSNDGTSLMVPCEWCVPSPEAQELTAGVSSPASGIASPAAASPTTCRSPEASPRRTCHNEVELEITMAPSLSEQTSQQPMAPKSTANIDDSQANVAFHGHPVSQQPAVASPTFPSTVAVAVTETTCQESLEPSYAVQTEQEATGLGTQDFAQGNDERMAPQRPPKGVEEEYIVVTERPPLLAARARAPARGPSENFCGDLSRIAHALEQLALKLLEQFPQDALALLLRALSLLEKALNVSLAEEEASDTLRCAFGRMLEEAEGAGHQVRASTRLTCSMESSHPTARPNRVIFEFAVQQARDAAVALSQGHEAGGWETSCHQKLTLALLLLDLLSSEADGEDLSVLASYTTPIARLATAIERRSSRVAGKEQWTHNQLAVPLQATVY